MPLRGPYKQYEVDTTVAVPKSTLYERRKRRIEEVDEDIYHGDVVDSNLDLYFEPEENAVINFEGEPNIVIVNHGEDTDVSDCQVRCSLSYLWIWTKHFEFS